MSYNRNFLYIQPYGKKDIKNRLFLFAIVNPNLSNYQLAKKFLENYPNYKNKKSNDILRVSGIVSYLRKMGWLSKNNSPEIMPIIDYFEKKLLAELQPLSKNERNVFNMSKMQREIEFIENPESEREYISRVQKRISFLAGSFIIGGYELIKELGIDVHKKESIQDFLEEFSAKYFCIVSHIRNSSFHLIGSVQSNEILDEGIANLYFQFFKRFKIEEIRKELNRIQETSDENSLNNLQEFILNKLKDLVPEYLLLMFVFMFLPIDVGYYEWSKDSTKNFNEAKYSIEQKLVQSLGAYRKRKVKDALIIEYMKTFANDKENYSKINGRIKTLEKFTKSFKRIKILLDNKNYLQAYKVMEELEKLEKSGILI